MRNLALIIVLFISVHLAWDASESTEVIGYKVYYGTVSRTYPYVFNAGNNLDYVITNVDDTKSIFFAVTAYSVNEESAYSDELEAVVIRTSGVGHGSYSWVKDGDDYGQLPILAIERNMSKNAILTISPSSGHQLTAMYLDTSWIAVTNPLTITDIKGPHNVNYVIQKIPTLRNLPVH
jgi:hypothetical protein